MGLVRISLAAALAALALVVAGCGGDPQVAGDSSLGATAASLVPADALAFVSIDTDQSSDQRQALQQLTSGLPIRAKVLAKLEALLAKQGLDYTKDVRPALGPELDLALLPGTDGHAEPVALTQPADESKLAALAAKFDSGDEHYTVERIGDWSVVADSADVFAAVNAAKSGRSLAETSGYTAAQKALPGDAITRAYADRAAFAAVPALKQLAGVVGMSEWVAATVSANGNALVLHAASPVTGTVSTGAAGLLGDIPSGVIAAAAFNGSAKLGSALSSLRGGALTSALGVTPATLASLAGGKGAVYVQANGLLPLAGLELQPQQPQRAMSALRAVASAVRARSGGMVALTVVRQGSRVYLADSQAAIAALQSSGSKLVDDSQFKAATAAAGVPAHTSFLVYADVTRLAPILSVVSGALGGKSGSSSASPTAKTIVAWGSVGGGLTRLGLWVKVH